MPILPTNAAQKKRNGKKSGKPTLREYAELERQVQELESRIKQLESQG